MGYNVSSGGIRPLRNPKQLLFMGRLVPIKGVDWLLRALAQCSLSCKVIVAGEGPCMGALQQQAKELGLAIEWLGAVSTHTRDVLMQQSDVVVVPSRRMDRREEGMPRVALEALAAGAKLIVSQSGGLADLPSSLCRQVPCDDVQALARAMEEAFEEAPALHNDVRELWLQKRSWSYLAPRILPGL